MLYCDDTQKMGPDSEGASVCHEGKPVSQELHHVPLPLWTGDTGDAEAGQSLFLLAFWRKPQGCQHTWEIVTLSGIWLSAQDLEAPTQTPQRRQQP